MSPPIEPSALLNALDITGLTALGIRLVARRPRAAALVIAATGLGVSALVILVGDSVVGGAALAALGGTIGVALWFGADSLQDLFATSPTTPVDQELSEVAADVAAALEAASHSVVRLTTLQQEAAKLEARVEELQALARLDDTQVALLTKQARLGIVIGIAGVAVGVASIAVTVVIALTAGG
jgi:hypothetical protein